ncbi:CLUMA_CG011738, isoform A [Clunio marinus]|uniref:CLUMA_CG011738, isoform A n=1 Tax=Clunio marinus TaxID=568069 RepID=A0A1J1IDT5_9DIPT|nr:CLUMA_CG011738, isoform A [Clunio marinus]
MYNCHNYDTSVRNKETHVGMKITFRYNFHKLCAYKLQEKCLLHRRPKVAKLQNCFVLQHKCLSLLEGRRMDEEKHERGLSFLFSHSNPFRKVVSTLPNVSLVPAPKCQKLKYWLNSRLNETCLSHFSFHARGK